MYFVNLAHLVLSLHERIIIQLVTAPAKLSVMNSHESIHTKKIVMRTKNRASGTNMIIQKVRLHS